MGGSLQWYGTPNRLIQTTGTILEAVPPLYSSMELSGPAGPCPALGSVKCVGEKKEIKLGEKGSEGEK